MSNYTHYIPILGRNSSTIAQATSFTVAEIGLEDQVTRHFYNFCISRFPKIGGYPQISNFNRIVHSKL